MLGAGEIALFAVRLYWVIWAGKWVWLKLAKKLGSRIAPSELKLLL